MDAQTREPDSGSAKRSEHILLVEDDPVVLEAVRRRLAFDGYRVDTARCGSEALRWLAGNSPDLVILAVTGSTHDEAETEARIRTKCTAPMLLLTAFRSMAGDSAVAPEGATDRLVKPFAIDELLMRIRSLLFRVGVPRGARAGAESRARESA